MSAKHGTGYTLVFAAAVCLVCSVFVCLSAVMLKDMQETNKQLDKQKNVLIASGLIKPGESVEPAQIAKLYESITPVVVELSSGEILASEDPASLDMKAAVNDDTTSRAVEANDAKVLRVPNRGIVYQVMEGDKTSMLVLPVSGKGLWSTMYGFLALDVDTTTVKGISFYEHGETPGLGGEIENPKWTALWVDRKIFDEDWNPVFSVIKGIAKSASEQPHNVDGLSGATLTCKGVSGTIQFWMGDDGFGPFLKKYREGGQ